MSDHSSPHEIQAAVRKYLIVFGILILGTILTVWAANIHFGSHAINIGVGLFIATVKAFCVAAYFMHLIDERKLIYMVLTFAAVFFAGMMYLTVWAAHDIPTVTPR
jgi:caa(3)-type oxidase subunit IV